ncbi:MAG: hypothetical protein MMC23_001699 [Stictis urceolatum]|nr:hypothetical protein [Stictis urceolata]
MSAQMETHVLEPQQNAMDKPLPPPPPVERTASPSPVLNSTPIAERPPVLKRPSVSSLASFQRPKKQVVWRGKKCQIALPLEAGKDENGVPKRYLQPHEVYGIFDSWQKKGFVTEGFNLNDGSYWNHEGQSRNIYPDTPDYRSETTGKRYKVNIPDTKAWDNYRKEVQEMKLRALGVSFGDEEPKRESPTPSNAMNRQASSQNSMAPGHPGAPQSANSFRSPVESAFSPAFPAQSNPFVRPQSIVSPEVSQGPPGGFHFPRQSMAFPPGQNFGMPSPFTMQSASPLSAALSQQLGSLPASRVVSPMADGRRQSIRHNQSPNPALLEPHNDSYFQGQTSLLPHMRPNEASTPKPQQMSGPLGSLRPFPERQNSGIVEPTRFISHPDIASPLPQGHRHNVSESLQREIDDAEYHLEESIRRQIEEDYEKTQQKADKQPDPEPVVSEPIMVQEPEQKQRQELESKPQPKEETKEEPNQDPKEEPVEQAKGEYKDNLSEIETDPSLANNQKLRQPSLNSVSAPKPRSNHTSKSSVSKLNVNAPEFVFDPTKSFTPSGMFNFGGPAMSRQTSASAIAPQSTHSKTTSNNSTFSGGLNVAAPAFTPSVSQQSFNVPERDFSFSSKMPTFNAGGPSFSPNSGLGISGASDQSTDEKTLDKSATKIFTKINPEDIVKPVKKSKAIPIVKPQSDSESEREENGYSDGEDGRVGRPEWRMKRARHDGGSGDEVPQFATPTTPKREMSTGLPRSQSSVHRRTRSISVTKDNQASSPAAATGQLKEILDELKESKESEASSSFEESEAQTGPEDMLKPTETAKEISEAEVQETAVNSIADKVFKPHPTEKKTSLSATAKSFNLNPGAGTFQPLQPVKPAPAEPTHAPASKPSPSVEAQEKPIKKSPFAAGLGASRYAKAPSPEPEPEPELEPEAEIDSEAERSPTLELAPAEKAMQSRIMNGVSYVEPSYEELDDVMQHLNGEDSDIGVERNPVDWRSLSRSNGSLQKHSPQRDYRYDSESDQGQLLRPAPHDSVTASPNRLQQPFQYLRKDESASTDSLAREIVSKNARFSPSYRPARINGLHDDSPVHRLNSTDVAGEISDWNDVVDSGDEPKFLSRAAFFDSRVDEVVGDILDKRLMPLEQGLVNINTALTHLGTRSGSRPYRRSVSGEVEDSDADDEDEVVQSRAISPLKDRKFEKLKAFIFESIGAQKLAPSQDELVHIAQSLAELKGALHERSEPREPTFTGPSSEDFAKLMGTVDELKTSLAQQQERAVEPVPDKSEDFGQLKETLAQLTTSMKERQESGPVGELKKTIEDAISRQMRGKSGPVTSSKDGVTAEKLQLKVNGLESMLKIAQGRADDEYKARRQVEDKLAEVQRSLKEAELDAAKYRESADETEETLRSFLTGQQEAKQHTAMLEEVNASNEKRINDLSERSAALEDTLEEYRTSYTEKKEELEEAKAHMKNLDEENQNLDKTLLSLKEELEEGISSKRQFQEKFTELQQDMAQTAENIARDQSTWRRKEEEHLAKHELQKARLEAEARTRERLEMEIDRLEKQERDAMKARFLVDQIRGENQHLVNMVNELRTKSHEVQEHSMKMERELHDSRESNRHEVQRIMTATKADVAAANQQVNILRANLESIIERLEAQVENMKIEAKESRQRYEAMLEEASKVKNTALREAAEAREAAMQEHYRFHERTLDEAISSHARTVEEINATHVRTIENATMEHERALRYIKDDHQRALNVALEDKKMTENYLNGRLTLADEKVTHYQERVASLEERLEIAKSAAQAAAEAAKAARGSSPPQASRASAPVSKSSELPEKISPQALRESIMVLQEQLHQRESQIETLEDQLSKVDKDAPARVKDREIEISWLRELLGVRLDDLQDIINTLSSPSYDRDAVRDAVIRLKANLQMEQQEKERAMTGGQRFPTLSSLTQVAASPRSLPLAAAAAWGNWRKGQTSLGSLAEMAAPAGATVNTRSASQTPSKSSPQSFLSGLLTPPASNLRQTPQAGPSNRPPSSASGRPLGGYSTPKRQISSSSQDNRRALSNLPPPETPPLLRRESYDQDAKSGHYSLDRYVNEEDEVASSMDGPANSDEGRAQRTSHGHNDEPFGPTIELAG